MERDSFENLLRRKVQEAELQILQYSNREKVWSAVQRKSKSTRILFYATAVILLFLGMVSLLYVREEKTPIVITKKVIFHDGFTAKTVSSARIKKMVKLKNRAKIFKQISEKIPLEKELSRDSVALFKEPVENVAIAPIVVVSAVKTAMPEFSVQFKRGKPVNELNQQNKETIARLKNFKIRKDTTVFANMSDRQKGLFRIKF